MKCLNSASLSATETCLTARIKMEDTFSLTYTWKVIYSVKGL